MKSVKAWALVDKEGNVPRHMSSTSMWIFHREIDAKATIQNWALKEVTVEAVEIRPVREVKKGKRK